MDDSLCQSPVPKCVYLPSDFNVQRDPDPLWQAPGYDFGDPHEFGLMMINSLKNMKQDKSVNSWREFEPQEYDECLLANAIAANFSWTSAQAHFLGFNHFNDLEYPLTAQTVLTDGQEWYFAVYQLNTLDLKHKFDQSVPEKCNLLWFQGPWKLFELDEKRQFFNWNDKVVETFLKLLFLKPSIRPGVSDLRPFIRELEAVKTDDDDSDLIKIL